MTIWQALALGIIQGLTEYLPISSSAHLRVMPALFGWDDPGSPFTAVVQLGTLAAVLIYFLGDIRRLSSGFLLGVWRFQPFATADSRQAWMIAAGTVPIVVCGLLFKGHIETTFRSLYVIAAALIALAVVLFAAEVWNARRGEAKPMSGVGWRDAIVIGLAQALALVPGSSRSGVTITAGLFCGFTREAAARFSFLLALPSVFAAGIYQLIAEWDDLMTGDIGLLNLAVATAASFVVGYLSIAFLLGFLRRYSTGVFIVYRLALGGLILALLANGTLEPN